MSTAATQPRKRRAAVLAVTANIALIVLKLAAGIVTGSFAIISEAMHSSIDLVASLITFVSVNKAARPADQTHLYGHEKIEYLSAAIEGMLILVGSCVIVYGSVQRLLTGATVQSLPLGIGVIAVSIVVNLAVSASVARTAKATHSPALQSDASHMRADLFTSVGVLLGLIAVKVTGAQWIDAVVALAVAVVVVVSGLRILLRSSRVLVDEALPAQEQAVIRAVVFSFGDRGVVGCHAVRTRGAGARRYIDMHVQFADGMTLHTAHATAHAIGDEIRRRLENADVLIHLEPQEMVRAGGEVPPLSGSPSGAARDGEGW